MRYVVLRGREKHHVLSGAVRGHAFTLCGRTTVHGDRHYVGLRPRGEPCKICERGVRELGLAAEEWQEEHA